jgi:6-phosphofructokinase 1
MALAQLIQQDLGLQVRVIRPGLIARSLTACVSEPDQESASLVGRETVTQFMQGTSDCLIALERVPLRTIPIPLDEVSGKTKTFPHDYLNENGKMPSPAFYDYALPLIGSIKPITRLKAAKVVKRRS